MRPLRFLIVSCASFIILAAAYALLIDKVVIPERTVPFPYRQFLLEASSAIEGKVIIDSGSNSLHGIDTSLLSDYFQAPTLIIADGAGYPLRNKIFRLKKYVGKGDVLILPLEWVYYTEDRVLPKLFLSFLADKNLSLEYYFNELPVAEKLRFIFTQYPLKNALESLSTRDASYISKSNPDQLKTHEDQLLLQNNESFGGTLRDGPEEIDGVAGQMSCDGYTSPHWPDTANFEISDVFRANLSLLQELAESGVAIYFTWPSMVDSTSSTCINGPEIQRELTLFSEEIATLVESKGFMFIGEFQDSHFTSECFLNTYYHLRYSCAQKRTTRLIDALKRDKVTPINSAYTQDDLITTATAFAKKLQASLPQ